MDESSTPTIAQIVLEHPSCAQVLHRHRIDFCCAGDQTLEAACAARGLDVRAVRADLDEASRAPSAGRSEDPRAMSTPALLAHIVERHHGYLRRTLPALPSLAAKVARVHQAHAPKLPLLAAAVEELADTLGPHVEDEEQVLFPALAEGRHRAIDLYQMMDEHRAVAGVLERIHDASDGFTVPPWGCASYRALMNELATLDADVRQHVHLENHVLVPRFIESKAAT